MPIQGVLACGTWVRFTTWLMRVVREMLAPFHHKNFVKHYGTVSDFPQQSADCSLDCAREIIRPVSEEEFFIFDVKRPSLRPNDLQLL